MVELNLPEPRSHVLYTRVTEANKQKIAIESKRLGINEAVLVDAIIENYFTRKPHVSKKTKLRKRTS
jgi:hypothetical protein